VFPASPFWDFSLRLYAREGVAGSCLRLQDRHGIDVNMLFFGLWLGMEGQVVSRRDVARLIARVRTLHEQVVKPLRVARTALKRMLGEEKGDLPPPAGAIRAAIKKSELDAEHLEQIMLTAARPPSRVSAVRQMADGRECARANAAVYFAVHGARLGRSDEADLAVILAALCADATAKLAGAGAPPRLGRKRLLARTGGGG
jgi:uncharacterized protein (TIGR02444 family)